MIKVEFEPNNYNQIFPVILDSAEYMFHLHWNNSLSKRGFSKSGWELSIYDPRLLDIEDFLTSGLAQYEALLQGRVKLMPNQQILNTASFDKLPTGALFVGDSEPEKGTSEDVFYVGLDNFGNGKRFNLYYLTREEIDEL